MVYPDCGTLTAFHRHERDHTPTCRACLDARNTYQQRRRNNGGPLRLPVEPLIAIVRGRGLIEPHGSGQTRLENRVWAGYHRARRRGDLSRQQADLLAVHLLGIHPANIWPEWFGTGAAA